MTQKVKCDSCYNEFESAISVEGPLECNQGYRCASSVTDNHLIGLYGSTVIDMQKWVWLDRPDWAMNGAMCDDCITKLIDSKSIILSENMEW